MRLDFLSFAPVFLKELRQIWHSKLLFILLFLAIACDLICLFLAYAVGDSFYVKSINVMIQGIVTLCSIVSTLAILTSSISRWQLERGDPAVDIALTSPMTPWRIAVEKTLAIALSNFLMIIVIAPINFFTFYKYQTQGSLGEVVFLLPASLLLLMAVIPFVLASCSSLSSKSRIKRNGLSGVVLLAIYFAFTGLLSLLKYLKVENYIFVFCIICVGFAILGIALMTSQLSPVKSDRNLFSHLTLLIMPLLVNFIIYWTNSNILLENIVPCTMGAVSCIFIIASVMERKSPSIRQIENCKDNPFIKIPSAIFSSGAFQSLLLSVITLVCALSFAKWDLEKYSFLVKIVIYLTIYSFLANIFCKIFTNFVLSKVYAGILIIAILVGFLGLLGQYDCLVCSIPWDGASYKISMENLMFTYVFVVLGNLYCYKNTIKMYFFKKDI